MSLGISLTFARLFPSDGQVGYALLTRAPVDAYRKQASNIVSPRLFYASNAAELYSTIRQLKEMRAGLDAAICGLEQAMENFSEKPDGGGRDH